MFSVKKERGMVLIGTYLTLSLFLVYSSALFVRTSTQRLNTDRLRDRYQATNMAQGAIEQLREDVYTVVATISGSSGNALGALTWIDTLSPTSAFPPNPPLAPLQVTGLMTGTGTVGNPRVVILPLAQGGSGSGQAWIDSVCFGGAPGNSFDLDGDCQFDVGEDILAPRNITIEAIATIGGVTKQLQATYQFNMGLSDIFRYAYFLNNYGWIDTQGGSSVTINGEVRANGDLGFSGNLAAITVNGDLYASTNPDLQLPGGGQVMGTISGNPNQASSWANYWSSRNTNNSINNWFRSRPVLQLTTTGQPGIGGSTKFLPAGQGWNSNNPRSIYQNQSPHTMPYLGDLNLYKTLANQHNGGSGSTLTYKDVGADGKPGTADDQIKTITAIYGGPNGIVGDNIDDDQPLVLIGNIQIDGPVVVPGDVVIRGTISGQGTIYAGRNVHIVGNVTYANPPSWPNLRRNPSTGRLEVQGAASGSAQSNLGTVDSAGTYTPP
ncbi:MAG: hypothetical protein HYT88_06755 [Candidatus Omnitrophica bacterium]|nr:hypothetical protein [Candidatus Omnitrophota bacterium]